MTPSAAVPRIAAAVAAAPARAGGTRVVAIDGPSGSGKTTLAAALSAALGGAPVVHLDHVYPGWDGLDAVVPNLVAWLLEPLAAGTDAGYRRYDWLHGRYTRRVPVPPAPVLLLEGAGAGARAIAPYLALLVWLDAPADVRYARAMARDGEGYRPHWDRWARQEAAHFAREGTAARAGISIDGGAPAEETGPR